jgi:hypothetical protein
MEDENEIVLHEKDLWEIIGTKKVIATKSWI